MQTDTFRHWQSRSIDQKQAASKLMIGLSGGALAFSASLLEKTKVYVGGAQSAAFHFHGAVQLASIALGVAFTLNRVRDFDLTSQIVRGRDKSPGARYLKDMRQRTRMLGRVTRRLYFWQAVTFVLGAISFILFVLLRFSDVLYPSAQG